MTQSHVVVVGASLAGLRTVQALRRRGHDGRITVIGDENALPYDRPPLSKGVMLGTVEPGGTGLVDAAALDALDVTLMLGEPATGLDVENRRVCVGTQRLAFDTLVVATGSHARTVRGLEGLAGVHVLRTAADAAEIRIALAGGARVAVIGGGFIGSEIAAAARSLQLEVAVVDPLTVLMQRGLGKMIGARMTQLHRSRGVALHLGRTVDRLLGSHAVEGMVLDDGTVIDADVVVIGVGADPNISWLDGSGLTLDDGVLCDRFMCAAPNVYAVGDVARWHHPAYGRSIRIEHWTAASEHAQAVAATLSGEPTAAASVPYVWTDQFGTRLQVAGLVRPHDPVRFEVDEPGQFVAVSEGDGVVQAALALARPAQLAQHRMAIARRWATAS